MRALPAESLAALLVAILVLAVPVAGAGSPVDSTAPAAPSTGGQTGTDDECAPVAADTDPDPPSDRLGWEDGCWADDAIDVTRSDGLNETELAAVVARSMARVERVREREFDARTPVEIISRETFADRTATRFESASDAARLHQNVKYEALFMVDESTDALDVQQRNTASGTLGYYSSTEDQIVIVSENTTAPKMNEITLAQELFHSLQYRQFDASEWDWSTRERHNANDGIIEGDGNYVDHRYQRRCEADWRCLEPLTRPRVDDRHVGLLAIQLQPYSDGPVFVRERYRDGGWEAVDAVYEAPPESTEQTIHTDRYRSDPPTDVNVTHTGSNGWHVLDVPGGVNYAEFGEAGLYSMLWYPAFETRNAAERREVIPATDWIVRDDGLDLYNYDHPYTDGWDGDRLYPYVNATSNRTGETGYVWKSVWDSSADAEEFARAYRDLIGEFDADPVAGYADTYRIEDGEFGDAYYLEQTDDTVMIVNAPRVAALSNVRRGAAPVTTPTPTDPPTAIPTTATSGGTGPGTGPSTPARPASSTTDAGPETPGTTTTTVEGTAAGSGPGFAVLAALAAVIMASLAFGRRRR